MENKMIFINLRLGNSRYRIKVMPEDEELFRTATTNADYLLSQFSLKFSDRSENDLLGMVALQVAYQCEVIKKLKEKLNNVQNPITHIRASHR